MKILVTGAGGFIGKALTERLLELNHEVTGINSSNGDITNYNTFLELKDKKIKFVFHLAAKTFVPDSWENPRDFYNVNFNGTENILEFCRTGNIPLTFVSAYLYGQPEKLPVSENSPINSNNPYAHSKYLAEQLCLFYAEYYNLKINIIRPFNVYGCGQNEKFIIPYIISQALNDEVIKVKDLSPKRDFIFLDDLIESLILSMKTINKFSIFNIGSGYSISIQDIIDIVQKILKTDKKIVSEAIIRKNEINDVIADISKANKELNWYPKHAFYDGIAKIIKFEQEKLNAG